MNTLDESFGEEFDSFKKGSCIDTKSTGSVSAMNKMEVDSECKTEGDDSF